jgi:HK97 family phage prohead protease
VEQIAAGAFRGILKTNPDVVFTYNHNADTVLGRTKSGTLRLTEDGNGLAFECDLPDTTLANDLHASVLRGDISSCSFAFSAAPDDSDWSDEYVEGRSVAVRTIKNFAGLFDISAVVRPAYPNGTSVQARGAISVESINRPSVTLYSGRNGKGFRVTSAQVTEWRNKTERLAAERRKQMMDLLLS